MTTRPPRPTPADPDTFEARWDRSVAKEVKPEGALRGRAIDTLIFIASTAAIVAAWVFSMQ